MAMLVYTIASNIAAGVTPTLRMAVGVASGSMHVAFALLRGWRLFFPFRFEGVGYPWSTSASIREVVIVGRFGLAYIGVGHIIANAQVKGEVR